MTHALFNDTLSCKLLALNDTMIERPNYNITFGIIEDPISAIEI